MTKKIPSLAAVFAAGFLAIVVYRGDRAADSAGTLGDATDRRIVVLERVWDFLPHTDRVYHERAKAYFDRSVNRLGEVDLRDADFRRAHENFVRSLALNPFSPRAHFDFAQALQYMNALDLPFPERYFDEYRKAAALSGADCSVNFEVGKVLLSRWAGLSPEERRFAEDIIRSLLAAGPKERPERLGALLNLWDLNVRDVAVLEKILPADADSYRQTARFMGAHSLDRGARVDLLGKAESLEFLRARDEVREAQIDLRTPRPKEALDRLRAAEKLLEGIRFYQAFLPKAEIDPAEWKTLRKAVKLGVVKARLETTRALGDVAGDLRAYLEIEDSLAALTELETLLKARGLLDEQTRSGNLDIDRLSLRLALYFKQHRWREVVQTGQALTQSLLVVPEDQRASIGRVFEIVGDSSQKLDDLYESNAFYERAISLGVSDAGVRLKLRRNYERLNDRDKLRELQPLVDERLTRKETPLGGLILAPEIPYGPVLVLDEKTYRLRFTISDFSVEPFPLISIVFNGRVVWEDYLKSPFLEVDLPAVLGPNHLEITAINRPLRPALLELTPRDENGILESPKDRSGVGNRSNGS
jgi:hypothetical protein